MTRLEIKPLTREIFERIEGSPPPLTMRGIAVTGPGDAIVAGAVSKVNGIDFIIFGSKGEFSKKAIILGWNYLKINVLDKDKVYYAIIDRDKKTAPGFLAHLGFEPFKDDIYIYRG